MSDLLVSAAVAVRFELHLLLLSVSNSKTKVVHVTVGCVRELIQAIRSTDTGGESYSRCDELSSVIGGNDLIRKERLVL